MAYYCSAILFSSSSEKVSRCLFNVFKSTDSSKTTSMPSVVVRSLTTGKLKLILFILKICSATEKGLSKQLNYFLYRLLIY